MSESLCRLCNGEATPQHSHILPAFVFRWMRESSAGGYLRLGMTPNRRVQDGLKRYWLCADCEELFSRAETDFANKVFYPYSNGSSSRIIYGNWLLRFCVSVSWRVLQFYKEEASLNSLGPDAASRVTEAEATWKAFLLGQRPHPGSFRQHLLPFDAIESITSGQALSPNLNRYLMRTTDFDILGSESASFVYSKLGRFVILGFIRQDRPNHWQGSRVHLRTGQIEPRKYTINRGLFDYINARARLVAELQSGISPRQAQKSDEARSANVEKYVGSDEFLAMLNDLRMFGDAAFTRDDLPEEGGSKESKTSS
jgi:hypothetical protein